MENTNDTTCDKCGVVLQIGDHPFCPHPRGSGFKYFEDGIPGGLTVENLGHTPITFYSHSEKQRYMREHGWREKVEHVPLQGSDKSPHTTRWVSTPDLRTREQRVKEMAAFLGLTVEEYEAKFGSPSAHRS